MATINKAVVSYEIKDKSPADTLRSCLDDMRVSNNSEATIVDGRPQVDHHPMASAYARDYKKATTVYNAGVKNMREIQFPVILGATSFITAIPGEETINLIFRHNPIEANNYEDDGDTLYGTHFLPHIFFLIRIFTNGNTPSIVIINTPYNADGKMFPHNSSSCRQMTSGFCTGAYGDQLNSLVCLDDLTLLISTVNGYLLDGTNIDDEYGRNYYKFTRDRSPSPFDISVGSELDAKLLAIVLNDPTVPWGLDLSRVVTNYRFTTQHFSRVFLDNYCGGGIIND